MKRIFAFLAALILATPAFAQPVPAPAISQIQANPAGARSALQLPAALADVGVPTNRPFIALLAGQSNMVGGDPCGNTNGSVFTASIAGTVLTVSGMLCNVNTLTGVVDPVATTYPTVLVGAGVTAGTTVTGQLTGTPGYAGTYSISASFTIASEMMGTGTKPIAANIYTMDSVLSPTAMIPAQFGVGDLITSAGCNVNTQALCFNNQGVQFANQLRASGDIPASRPIIIPLNAISGQSISQWIGTGLTSPYFVAFQQQMAIIRTAYPGATIDHVIWSQGEGDYTTGPYASETAYKAGFLTLLAQWRAQPSWSQNTTVSMTQLATFPDNAGFLRRNDAIQAFANGGVDPYVTMVSGSGAVVSQVNSPHYDGNFLGILGAKHLAAWKQARIAGKYHDGLTTYYGSALAFRHQISVTTDTTLTYDDICTGADIDWSGGILTFPNPSSAVCGASVTIYLHGFVGTLKSLVAGISTPNGASNSISFPINPNTYVVTQVGGFWHLEAVYPHVGGFVLSAPVYTAGSAIALSTYTTRGQTIQVNNNATTLPVLSSAMNGSFFSLYGAPAGTASTITMADASSSIKVLGGRTVASFTVAPGQFVSMVAVGSFWVVEADSFATSYTPKLASAPAAAPGAGAGNLFMVPGTTGGTCKLQMTAGTSTTPVTIIDNVGTGC